ncbi:MAG: carboxylating nicotinate-nucleotide diphosphorylase [Acidobacteria bacterium]|nr:carboxylating nicotinate-nucleotide diphosphorylase [Acidobacteriota bacterium]
MELDLQQVSQIVQRALEEDIDGGDLTSDTLFSESMSGKAEIIAKQGGILAGLPVAEMTFQKLDEAMQWEAKKPEGAAVSPGEIVVVLKGNLRAILNGERVALNFLQRMSGIATLTRRFVKETEGYPAKILDTRKTAPGLRVLDKYAVRMGGGFNHRFGLYDGILLKDNHLRAAGSIGEAVRRLRQRLSPTDRIEVEVCTLPEVEEALQAGADILLLDNMSAAEIEQAMGLVHRKALGRKALVEASGGVNLNNVKQIAATGVDYISVGALTHSAPALDISLELAA